MNVEKLLSGVLAHLIEQLPSSAIPRVECSRIKNSRDRYASVDGYEIEFDIESNWMSATVEVEYNTMSEVPDVVKEEL